LTFYSHLFEGYLYGHVENICLDYVALNSYVQESTCQWSAMAAFLEIHLYNGDCTLASYQLEVYLVIY